MAFTIAFAMLGSLVVALTLVPVLSAIVFRGKFSEEDNFLMRFFKMLYRPALNLALSRRWLVIGAAIIALVASLSTLPFLGTEFVPELDEGTMAIRVTMNPSISLEESKRIATRLEKKN